MEQSRKKNKNAALYVIKGAFEMEALSNDAVLVVIELPGTQVN